MPVPYGAKIMNTGKDKKETRKYEVLGHIVQMYVSSASPVSSKLVSRRMGDNVSSATIRNIMAELEEEGYIEQPHTSAGRVPTNLGYRNYVNKIKDHIRSEKREAERLSDDYARRIATLKDIIEKTSFLISRELHNASVVIWPSLEDSYLKHIELIKLKAETVVAVLVTAANAVENYIIKLDEDLKKTELDKISQYINVNYGETPFSLITGRLNDVLRDTQEEGHYDKNIVRYALGVVDSILSEKNESDVCLEGLDYFMDEDVFGNMDTTRRVLHAISGEREGLGRFMRSELPYGGIRVYIGDESKNDVFKECSIVTSGYSLRGRTVGRIGVIGPTRMDYSHAIRTMGCLSDLISSKLEEIE